MVYGEHEKSMGPEQAAEAAELKIVTEKLVRAQGQLVEVKGIRSLIGERLFVSARYGPDAQLPEPDHFYLNVDLFAERNGQLQPIGIRDFEVKKDSAFSNKQRHGYLADITTMSPRERKAHAAADRWSGSQGITISETTLLDVAEEKDPLKGMHQMRQSGLVKTEHDWQKKVYQNRELGTLLNVIGLQVLRARGIKKIVFGSLTPAAQKMWRRFGYQAGEQALALTKVFERSFVQQVMQKLLKK